MCLASQNDPAMTYSLCNEPYLTLRHEEHIPKIESFCSMFACCAVAFSSTFETYVGYICNTDLDFIVWNSLPKLPNTVVRAAAG